MPTRCNLEAVLQVDKIYNVDQWAVLWQHMFMFWSHTMNMWRLGIQEVHITSQKVEL